jgi:hypothetical protein
MAVIAPTINRAAAPNDSMIVVTWTPVTEADTCAPISLPTHPRCTMHATGAFGAGLASLQGSNNGTDFATLIDQSQTAQASLSAAGLRTSADQPLWYRPHASGGTSMSLTFVLAFSRG